MRSKSTFVIIALAILFIMGLILTGCKTQQEPKPAEDVVKESIASIKPIETEQPQPEAAVLQESKEAEIKNEILELLKEIKQERQELQVKEREYEQNQIALEAKAKELSDQETSLKTFRTVSWAILITGAVLFIIGLIFIVISRKRTADQRQQKKAEKEKKKLNKAAEKEEKKTEKNLKKAPEKKSPAPKKKPEPKPGTEK